MWLTILAEACFQAHVCPQEVHILRRKALQGQCSAQVLRWRATVAASSIYDVSDVKTAQADPPPHGLASWRWHDEEHSRGGRTASGDTMRGSVWQMHRGGR